MKLNQIKIPLILPLDGKLQFFGGEPGQDGDPTPNPNEPTAPSKKEKLFTQDEVDAIVQERLARAKKQMQVQVPEDYEELKAKLQDFEELQTKLQDYDELKSKYEQLENENKRNHIIRQFEKAARNANIEYVDAAIKLADIDSFELDDEGNIKDLDTTIQQLVEANPFLTVKAPKNIGGSANPGQPNHDKTNEQLLEEAKIKYRRTGRPEDLAAFSKLKNELLGG